MCTYAMLFSFSQSEKKKALSANSTTVVPGDLPHGILHLFAWVRNDALRACIASLLYIAVTELSFGYVVVRGHLMTYFFFMSVKENTVPVNIRQHGNVVTNSFFSFCWFK